MNSSHKITVGARGSPLSLAQVAEVFAALPHLCYELTCIETVGDRDQTTSLRTQDKTDFFTREIDALQLDGAFQISIHSAKDLPDPIPRGLTLVALTGGLDPSDSLVLRQGLTELPVGARIGTSSLRRMELLRPDLIPVDIRGSIDKRLSLLDSGALDGLIVAEAALLRLKINRPRIPFPSTTPYQGQLAILARTGDTEMESLFAPLDTRRNVLYLGTDPSNFRRPLSDKLIHHPILFLDPLSPDLSLLSQATHIIFTSKNAVPFFPTLPPIQIIAIGPSTAAALEAYGHHVTYMAPVATQEGIISLLSTLTLSNPYFFLPRSSQARSALTDYLTLKNYRYHVADLYAPISLPAPALDSIDEIVFTSPSTVKALFAQTTPPAKILLTSIGPVTERALRDALSLDTGS